MDYKTLLDNRRNRGKEIVRDYKLKFLGDKWEVPSQTGHGSYIVKYVKDAPTCTCPDYEKRRIKCKHQFAVELIITKQIDAEGKIRVRKIKRITYSQDWEAYDEAQTTQKENFLKLLNDLCKIISQPEYTFGRPKLPLSDMVFASALKVFTTFSLRRFETDIQTAKEKGFVDKVPHYSTVALYMENKELTPVIKQLITVSSLPLKSIEDSFAIDSSGFSTTRFARWFDHKYGKETDKRIWIKAHMVCGVKTNVITATELTITNEADVKFLPQLITETAENFQVKEVSGDKAYSSRDNLEFVDSLGAVPYIPFRTNTTGKPMGSTIWKKMHHYFLYKHDEFLQHYHKRSNAETVFHMIKSKFGDAIRSKSEVAQVNEVLLKILCHNICVVIQEMHELGIEPNFFVEKV